MVGVGQQVNRESLDEDSRVQPCTRHNMFRICLDLHGQVRGPRRALSWHRLG